ncbi:cyclic pyranopterin monophosphate synthase, mitochondrial [Impatiens glandulifera]|uniref:cyclic pyranopterin monophosphate synthase, mitochondrial n=1 Tax=Impatiens glandulifera TaxID=253017 RepID=UPI001FB178CB|nr:cyclic pyranopterin monophosphate synthase, mitochondrial [Impatiens glandulifera]XP_047338344.1 cyclic pyranopterin monophosphate synthase, mitochondrial [Impatiens glandulifera]
MILRQFGTKIHLSRRLFSSSGDRDIVNAIAELNKEMEHLFGESPVSGPTNPSSENPIFQEDSSFPSPSKTMSETRLTHVDTKGEAQMVDVSSKETTKRVAIASCKVILGKSTFDLVSSNQMGKGDAISVARLAGIIGAKQTSNLIPLCHNINLSHVRVDLNLNPSDFSIDIEGEASSSGKTGVEMEAMMAVSVAGLTVYDMCKAASKGIEITNVRLERKSGGKSGDWFRGTK